MHLTGVLGEQGLEFTWRLASLDIYTRQHCSAFISLAGRHKAPRASFAHSRSKLVMLRSHQTSKAVPIPRKSQSKRKIRWQHTGMFICFSDPCVLQLRLTKSLSQILFPKLQNPMPRDSSPLSSADGYIIACTTTPKEEDKGTAEDGHGRKQRWKRTENNP